MRIFVTNISPKDKIIEYGISLSASNFNYNLIEGHCFDKVYSIYPGFVKGKLDKLDDETFEAVYSSWRWKGKLRQRLARFVEQYKLFRKIPRKSTVWYYNLSTLNVLLVLLLKIFKPSVQQNIIILDFTPDLFFNKRVLSLINRMHGRISLSTYEKFNSRNLVVMPGVVPVSHNSYPQLSNVKREFLLSGALRENIAMHSMLLDAFAEMPELTLHISGVLLDHKGKTESYSRKYPNIHFYGKMPYNEYNELLSSVSFSFNTRKPTAPENKCNFPSKVIEALLYNRIVISTIHYPQLEGINYLEVPTDKEAFKQEIRRIAALSDTELLRYANQSEEVIRRFSTEKWNDIMAQIEEFE
ncbi:glycosyl transferase group 1 [Phocaeicola salanitronis DSM 18170]|uniref:Glycosyl transferase group 1 n=1 Tax=Phocaeicola salanitronis (strain DSM 18170 / JCM 13657 / CCUG 60908 / BL78) TaxID=667015 RepID=F0R0E7_PHOSB|nr:glycosyltransferase [Phocaeicola salanitronis]ADY37291.1 glycosyl transferase group 1 [Phocaeicola salanitronis DSM 18170]